MAIKCLPEYDRAYNHCLGLALKTIENFSESMDCQIDIDYYIELFNSLDYYNNSQILDQKTRDSLNDNAKLVSKFLGNYFNQEIDVLKLPVIFSRLNPSYTEDFWKIFDKFKFYNRVDGAIFLKLSKKNSFNILDVLKHKSIVRHYHDQLRQFLIENECIGELLYVIQNPDGNFFPDSINKDELNSIFLKHVRSGKSNLFYLEQIIYSMNNKFFEPSDDLKYEAEKLYDQLESEKFSNQPALEYTYEVKIADSSFSESFVEIKGRRFSFYYSSDWIKNNLDFPTLLNNFIYLFEFTDPHIKIRFLSNYSEDSLFELTANKDMGFLYYTNMRFESKNALADLQLLSYYKYLNNLGVSLEKIFFWFFDKYISSTYNVPKIKIRRVEEELDYYHKCKDMCDCIEIVLRQYNLFCEKGVIDYDYLKKYGQFSSFHNIKSLVKNKYAYGCGNDLKKIIFLLFSNQSGLQHTKEGEEICERFCDLICETDVLIEDFDNFNHGRLQYLIEQKIVFKNEHGFIKFVSSNLINILLDIYNTGFVSRYHYGSEYSEDFDFLESSGLIKYDSSLFSSQEADYFHYFLNRKNFINGKDLRNVYSHGAMSIDEDENIHATNYFILIKIMILIIIKINDDLSLYYDNPEIFSLTQDS